MNTVRVEWSRIAVSNLALAVFFAIIDPLKRVTEGSQIFLTQRDLHNRNKRPRFVIPSACLIVSILISTITNVHVSLKQRYCGEIVNSKSPI